MPKSADSEPHMLRHKHQNKQDQEKHRHQRQQLRFTQQTENLPVMMNVCKPKMHAWREEFLSSLINMWGAAPKKPSWRPWHDFKGVSGQE